MEGKKPSQSRIQNNKRLEEELKLRITVICDKRLMLLQFVGSLEVGKKELRRLGVAGHIGVVRREILVMRISKSDGIKGGFLNKEGEVVFGSRKQEMAVCRCTKSTGALYLGE